jgi:hypothetical protein
MGVMAMARSHTARRSAQEVAAEPSRSGRTLGSVAHLALSLVAYSAAAAVLACSVRVAAVGLDQPGPVAWSSSLDEAASLETTDAWCKMLNGRPICFGEPD